MLLFRSEPVAASSFSDPPRRAERRKPNAHELRLCRENDGRIFRPTACNDIAQGGALRAALGREETKKKP